MGGQTSKVSGPSHAFLGADGRPYYEPDADEERARCCCIHVARGVLKLTIVILFLAIVGLDAVALIAGYKQYFTYYSNHATHYQIKTGWLRWSSSDAVGQVLGLRSLGKALWILGIVSAFVTGITCLLALWMAVSTLFRQLGRRSCCCALPVGFIQIGVLVAYYVLAAVEVSKRNGDVLNVRRAPWPSWAWCFAVGAGLIWVVNSILMLAIPAPTIHVPNEYLQNEAAAARGWGGRAAQAPVYPPEHEAAGMGVNAPSSAPVQVEEPRLSYTVKQPGDGSKRGLFGKKDTSGSQPYRSRTEEIAQRYRGGSSADVELPQYSKKGAWS